MDNGLGNILQQMPFGEDIFAFLEEYIQQQVTPDLRKPFWIQAWLAIVGLGVMAILMLLGLALRYRKGRLNLILYDGAVTRLDHRVWVPMLWCVEAFVFIAHGILFHQCMQRHRLTTPFGRFWSSLHIPLICSYCLISSSVVASAPPVRSWLSKIRYGVVVFNLSVFCFIVGICAVLLPVAFQAGRALGGVTDTLDKAVALIRAAKMANDLSQLSGLLALLPDLQRYGNDNVVAGRNNAIIATAYIFFFLLTGFAPAIVLSRVVNRKIARLENNSSTNFGLASSMDVAVPTSPSPLLPGPHSTTAIRLEPYSPTAPHSTTDASLYVPELPSDRPFGSLAVTPTAPLPPRFQDIIEDKGQSGKERASRLRAVLKHDQTMTVAYCFMLLSFSAFLLFESCKEKVKLSTKQGLLITYAFPLWNFLFPGMIVAVNFLLDAWKTPSSGSARSRRNRRHAGKEAVTPLPVVNQTVDIVYTEGKEKDGEEEDDKLNWPVRHVRYM